MLPAEPNSVPSVWGDGERVFSRTRLPTHGADAVLIVRPAVERPPCGSFDRFSHEFSLRDELDSAWAVRPLELRHEGGVTFLLLEDPGGEPLEHLLGAPMDVERFLRFAAGIAAALGKFHQRGLVHKDVKPANILVNCTDGQPRLTGFGIASRLPRQRQAPDSPETIAGTLAYMAPEQTGRMNRSIDARSDLYALGVTFYQMLTGALPFAATDAMDWVHCHIARKPVPPSQRLNDVPTVASAIVMKLLAKTAEERYQTASGVEHDLRRCLRQWEALERIDPFSLGERDIPDRLLIPEQLYGREREIDTLLAAFDRIVKGGAPELVLVSGYSGIGKSSVVQELHKVLVPPRGLFAAGKFDRYNRDVPYATLAQAFQGLVRPLLGKSDTELNRWRDALREALGPNGRLIIEVVPELKHIIGEQPPVPELPPQDAQRRFQWVFRRFIGVFARPEHPLALFLDDLQWLDAATLDLLEDLLTRSDLQHLMLIGAYRDNEVPATHPLRCKIEAINAAGGKVADITIAPLARAHLGQLIADALHCELDRAAPLAKLLHEKTGGNPFFVIQFLYALAEEGLLAFDHEAGRWAWDVGRILAKPYTDNVGSLMVSKLSRLPAETRKVLPLFACLGSAADVTAIAIVLEAPEEQVHTILWPVVRQGLVERVGDAYRFVHDRVQEAVYSLIPLEQRSAVHLKIGRLLAAHTPPEKRETAIFDIVNHLNRGATLVASQDEREQLAEFNLLAGQRAKSSAAYASALIYLAAGAALLPEATWERLHELNFALELQRAECEHATGALAQAEARLAALSTRASTTGQFATVACLRIDLAMTIGQLDQAVAIALDSLRHLGIDWPLEPTEEQVRCEYERIWSQLGDRTIEEICELPLMSDPDTLATIDLLMRVATPALVMMSPLFPLVICRAANLSLEHGHSEASCVAYEFLAMAVVSTFGTYDVGLRFASLGNDLAEMPELKRFQARTLQLFASVTAWTRHVRTGHSPLLRAFEIANCTGDLTFAATACGQLNAHFQFAGDPLDEAQRQAENGLEFAQKLGFAVIVDGVIGQLGLIRTLRGFTTQFGSFDDGQFKELEFERHLSSNPSLAMVECWYYVRKLQARYFGGDYAAAFAASSRARPLLQASVLISETAEYHFYSGLTHAACWDSGTGESREPHFEALMAHHLQLRIWAENCPDNFENRAALVGAEIARIEGRALDAMDLYERAIRSARASGFVHNEALANELAARFWVARGFENIARMYLRDARHCYLTWGAHGKVRQLDEQYRHLREDETSAGPTTTIGTSLEHLDLATVIKVSQVVAGELVLEKLLDKLMRTVMAQAGAERVLLVLGQGDAQRIVAEATTSGETVSVHLRMDAVAETALPTSVLHYVVRTGESVILDDAADRSLFSADPYISSQQARSMLCLPLLAQAKLIGVLYLENSLVGGAFAPTRIAVLRLLASQVAIALENARLYRDLAEREAKIQRLVDANIVGIFFFDLEGRILEANEAFLRIVKYDRQELQSGRLRWTDLTPPEWLERDKLEWMPLLKSTRMLHPYEKEYFSKGGSRVPVLIGAAIFEEGGTQGVAFVLDLSKSKRVDAELREMQTQLSHANRVATMGQLTASIAHEVRQPISAMATTAAAALRWLSAQSPNVHEAIRALNQIVLDAERSGEITTRIRNLFEKAPPRKDCVDINEAVREIVELARDEALKHGVSVHSLLEERLPPVLGDRVQLQQVVLNLILNAIEAMSTMSEEPRELLISTTSDLPIGVSIAVGDSGPGLPTGEHECLFNPFYTTKPGGLGMGLSICRSIVEAHGGQLCAESNSPRGALFRLTLPLHAEHPSNPGNAAEPTPRC